MQKPGQLSTCPPPDNVGSNPGQGAGGKIDPGQGNRKCGNQDKQAPFTDQQPLLDGHIFDDSGEHTPDQYLHMMHEISNYVGNTYMKYTSDFTRALEDLVLTDPVKPVPPNPANQVEFELWKLNIKEH